MAYFPALVLAVVDAGRVAGATGAVANGCRYAVPSRTGPGVYRLTFAAPLVVDAADMVIEVTQTFDAAVGGGSSKCWIAEYRPGGANAIEIRTTLAATGAAADMTFDWELKYLGSPGVGVG